MREKKPIILPEKYYLNYFNYLLNFVTEHYQHILEDEEYFFIQNFRGLTEDAQCLYLRFSNRKGNFFRLSKINYSEIKNLNAAKEELLIHEFIDINASKDPAQFSLFTKAELINHFSFLDRKERKANLLMELSEWDIQSIHENEEIAEVKKNQEVAFLKLLFFGNRYHEMTEFVIRDVGNVKLKSFDESKFQPWFQSRSEALGVMHISQLKKMIREVIVADLPLEEFLINIPWEEWRTYPRSKEAAEKLLLEIGTHFEKNGKLESALSCYQRTALPPSGERQIRILEKLDQSIKALDLAKKILEQPGNASELTFASDYLNRSGIRINRSMTRRLHLAKKLELPEKQARVEQEVLHYYKEKGWQGVHSENFIWRSMFGIVFWEELFNEDHGTFHHPLQREPSDLDEAAFFTTRKIVLEKRVEGFKTRKQLFNDLSSTYDENFGIANRFVTWHDQLLPILEIMIQRLPLKSIKLVLLEMAKQTKENSTGFPDLFIWKKDDYHFYEIKSPNDHLSAQQLFWLDFLTSARIKADVLRVSYSHEPNVGLHH
ncbi:MAG: VRR-NUC domain-containing protein [Bacteroidota bacterium]